MTEKDNQQNELSDNADGKKPGRGWTARYTGQIRYRRYTDLDGGGRPSILFKFELAPGQTDLPQEVYDVLHKLKSLDRDPAHGRGSGQRPSGLEFTRDTKHGRVWRLPDNPTGRLAADIIDAKLSDLARSIDGEPSTGR